MCRYCTGEKKKSRSHFPAQRPSTSITSSLGGYTFIATLAELHTCPAGMTATARAAHRVRDRSSHRSRAPIMLITARPTNTSHVFAARRACAIHIVRRSSDVASFFVAFMRVTRCSPDQDPIETDPVSFYHRTHALSLLPTGTHTCALPVAQRTLASTFSGKPASQQLITLMRLPRPHRRVERK